MYFGTCLFSNDRVRKDSINKIAESYETKEIEWRDQQYQVLDLIIDIIALFVKVLVMPALDCSIHASAVIILFLKGR